MGMCPAACQVGRVPPGRGLPRWGAGLLRGCGFPGSRTATRMELTMRLNLSSIGLGVGAVALLATLVPSAGAAGTHVAASHHGTASVGALAPSPNACYAQLDNDNGVGLVSQKFELDLKEYRSQ